MYWEIALGLLIVIQTISIVLTKINANNLPEKAVGVFYQYLFCFGLAILFFLAKNETKINSVVLLTAIGAIGFVNAFGTYSQWKAFDINMSKTVLFFPLMDIVSIGLAIFFLGEINLWNAQMTLGIILCFLAIWLFRSSKNISRRKEILNRKWLFFTLSAIVIFGIAAFLVKVSSFTVPSEIFLLGWYGGALLASVPLLALEKQRSIKVPKRLLFSLFLLAATTVGALFALYLTFQLKGPISLVLPLRGVFITIIPVVIGWTIFKERKELSKKEILAFLCGIIGVLLILLR
ncbi:hypothetical protein KAR26_02475 [Candidatus Parcubacteria bacterium]|nr:hypothetical protein [Candidatus Parcubacteria bacterium]